MWLDLQSIDELATSGNNYTCPLCHRQKPSLDSFKSNLKTFFLPNYWAIQRSWFARVNALCNLSRKKSQRTSGPISRCFTLCITVEVEPRIAKQYKCQYCGSCKNYRGKGMEGGKKVSLRRFLADQKIASS